MLKTIASLATLLFAVACLSSQAYAQHTGELYYSDPPTHCTPTETVVINAAWANSDKADTGENPNTHLGILYEDLFPSLNGVTWHCINNYSASIFYLSRECKCLGTSRAADQVLITDPPNPARPVIEGSEWQTTYNQPNICD